MSKAKGRTIALGVRVTPELHRRIVHASHDNITTWVNGILEQYLNERGIWPPGEGPPDPAKREPDCARCDDEGWVPHYVTGSQPSLKGSSICPMCLNRKSLPQSAGTVRVAGEAEAQMGLNDTWPGDRYP